MTTAYAYITGCTSKLYEICSIKLEATDSNNQSNIKRNKDLDKRVWKWLMKEGCSEQAAVCGTKHASFALCNFKIKESHLMILELIRDMYEVAEIWKILLTVICWIFTQIHWDFSSNIGNYKLKDRYPYV